MAGDTSRRGRRERPRENVGAPSIQSVFFCLAALLVTMGAAPASADVTLVSYPDGLVSFYEDVAISWQENLECELEYGRAPGTYTGETQARGWGSLVFTPVSEGLSAGVYYCALREVGGAETSEEFTLIVDSPVFPSITSPPNASVVTQTTTILAWDPVDGVPYYHVVVSDHGIDVEQQDGELVVSGANIVWQAITGATSIQYGSEDPSGYFTSSNGASPPLMNGLDYHWLVFNNFGGNPLLSSTTGAGLGAFSVEAPVDVGAPVPASPADGALLCGDYLTFEWQAVAGASGYHVYLYQIREWGQAEASFPVWDTATPTCTAEIHAGAFLTAGEYLWRVVALDSAGRGSASAVRAFEYVTEAGTARIRTKRDDGSPVPNAMVEIELLEGGVDIRQTVTDEGGAANEELIPGAYLFKATKPDYRDTTATALVPEGGDVVVTITMRKAPARFRGQVVDEAGAPVFDATVRGASSGTEVEGSSDHDGRFVVRASAGDWTVWAEKAGFASSHEVEISLAAGDYTDVGRIVLTGTPGAVSGNVINGAGAAVWGALVTAEGAAGSSSATSDASGHFSFSLAPGVWTVTALKSGFLPSASRVVLVEPAAETQLGPPLVITAASCAVMGRATDGGVGVAGARVTAVPLSGETLTVVTNEHGEFTLLLPSGPFELLAEHAGYIGSEAHQVDVTSGESYVGVMLVLKPATCTIQGKVLSGTDPVSGAVVTDGESETLSSPSGSFSLAVSPGLHVLRASRSGYMLLEPLSVAVFPSGTVEGLELRMAGGACGISGRVSREDEGVPFAHVVATSNSDAFETDADNNGDFAFCVEAGEWSVTANRDGLGAASVENVVVAAGQSVEGLRPEVEELTAFLTGRVLDENGPVRTARIVVTDDESGGGRLTTTDTEGRYLVRIPEDTPFTIRVRAAGHGTWAGSSDAVAAEETRILDLSLPVRRALIRGRVTDDSDIALPGTIVSIEGSTDAPSKTGPSGRYELWCDEGTHDVAFARPGYDTVLRHGVQAGVEGSTLIDVTLPDALASLSGRVTDSLSGEALSGALVTALLEDGGSCVTGADGVYVLADVAPGTVDVSVSKPGFAPRTITLELAEGQNELSPLALLRLTGEITGAVAESAGGAALAGANVRARIGADVCASALSGANGRYVLEGLDPNELYDVYAAATSHTAGSMNPVEDVAPGGGDVDFVLVPCSGRIAGVVRDEESGSPLEGAVVSATDGAGHFGSAHAGAGGSFAIEALADDRLYEVVAGLPGYHEVVIDGVVPDGEPIDVRLPRNFGTLTGSLTAEEGLSLTDVIVVATSTAYSGGSRTAEPDGAGEYLIDNVRPGTYVLRTSGPGYFCAPTQLTVTVGDGQVLSGLDFLVRKADVERIDVSGPTEVEAGATACFSASAFSGDGTLVGADLEWWMSPAGAGEIARGTGTVMVAASYFGEMTVTARDRVSGEVGRRATDVYVTLSPTESVTAMDSLGVTLAVDEGAVSETKSVFIDHETLPDAMRYSRSHAVSREAFRLKPVGTSFGSGGDATLSVPPRAGLSELVRWDRDILAWEPMECGIIGQDLIHDLSKLGLFALRGRSDPLGVSDVRAYPNPFSPSLGPAVISYELTSVEARMPFVTVRVFNMTSQLVRELVSNEPQAKGVVQLEWDGLTDAGEKARNGRYVIEVQARDTGGTETALGTVVLVK